MDLRLLFLFIFASAASCMEPIFKTCQESDFCNRLRHKSEKSGYCIDEVYENDVSSSFVLKSNKNSKTLILTLEPLENAYRIIIDEPAPSPRFRLKETLDGEPKSLKYEIDIENEKILYRTNVKSLYAVITPCPLKIEIYQDSSDVPLVVINHNDKLTVETDEPNVAIALDVQFPAGQRAYGIPEHADHLALRNTSANGVDPYRLYNLDVAFYELESTVSLYGAIPVLYAHGTLQTSGVFWHNGAESWIDVSSSLNGVNAYFMSESGVIDIFVLPGPTPKDAVRQYASLTGTAPLPQYFTLGHHQCRWNYMSEDDVQTVVAEFDNHDFPLDVIWLDIEYTDDKKYFTWDPETFPNPLKMQANLTATNRKLVTIIDPHIKKETGYFVYDEALANDHFVKNSNGSVYEGECWPGLSSYLDFLNPETREFYAGLYAFDKFKGSTENTYIWNDMNEPSVFDDSIEKTFPKDLVHYGNVKHRDIHNIYGFLQTKGTYQGLIKRSNNTKRPFILTRSHFAGSQRYTAVWTGDNTADWGHLAASIPMCLTEALAGISFCGADVGGFFYDPPVELLERWYQIGAWLPFYRAHANMDTERREPYLFPKDVQSRIRAALRQRYAHLPLWYTLFWEHSKSGDPVIRPLFYNYPKDSNVLDIDTELIVGTSVLIRVVAEPNVTAVNVYFPGGSDERWYDINNNFSIQRGVGYKSIDVTLDKIPVYYRGGSVIPRKDIPRPSSVATHGDPYSLYVLPDDKGYAEGTLYIDDKETFNYQKGDYHYIRFVFQNGTLRTSFENMGSKTLPDVKINRIVYADVSTKANAIRIHTKDQFSRFLPTISRGTYVEARNLDLNLLDLSHIEWLV